MHNFLGGTPGAVALKLGLLSLLVGAFMALIGLSPEALIDGIFRLIQHIVDLGFESVHEIGRWLIYGAVIVVPIWLMMRLIKSLR